MGMNQIVGLMITNCICVIRQEYGQTSSRVRVRTEIEQ